MAWARPAVHRRRRGNPVEDTKAPDADGAGSGKALARARANSGKRLAGLYKAAGPSRLARPRHSPCKGYPATVPA